MENQEIENKKSNMLLAFILNFTFTIIELVGGLFTNSVSIISDAIHDLGDSISIGLTIFLEKKSHKKADETHTYGYARYSIIGAIINLTILVVGITIILMKAIPRLFNIEEVNSNGMLIISILGIIINGFAVIKTFKTEKISEKIVSLHLLEDTLGWIMVFISSIFIKYFNFYILDPILSILICIIIGYNVILQARKILDVLLEKVPHNIDVEEVAEAVTSIRSVLDIHHIHIWSLDGVKTCMTAHISIDKKLSFEKVNDIKLKIREKLKPFKISHLTLEMETEKCKEYDCDTDFSESLKVHTHHHHE